MHNVARSFSTNKSINVQFWNSSISTFISVNPSFRVFEIDVETMLPVRIHTYYLNLKDPHPQWVKSHELTEFYGLKDLSP